MERLKYFVNNEFKESGAEIWYDLHNPSTGEVTGQAPCCTNDEVLEAIEAAKAAFPAWKNTPARKRAAVLIRFVNFSMSILMNSQCLFAKKTAKLGQRQQVMSARLLRAQNLQLKLRHL